MVVSGHCWIEPTSTKHRTETPILRGFHFSAADCYRQSYRHNLIAGEPATGYAPHLNALPNASPHAGSTGAERESQSLRRPSAKLDQYPPLPGGATGPDMPPPTLFFSSRVHPATNPQKETEYPPISTADSATRSNATASPGYRPHEKQLPVGSQPLKQIM